MFGNAYTALVIQINSQYAGNVIWERIKTYSFVKHIERFLQFVSVNYRTTSTIF